MSYQIRKIDERYTLCDWCNKEILITKEGSFIEEVHTISGDFPAIHIHKETCLRQAVCAGIQAP